MGIQIRNQCSLGRGRKALPSVSPAARPNTSQVEASRTAGDFRFFQEKPKASADRHPQQEPDDPSSEKHTQFDVVRVGEQHAVAQDDSHRMIVAVSEPWMLADLA